VKRYWDTSALLNAFWDSRIEKLSREPDQWTRSHTLAEMFSTLTGGRLGFQFHPADAAEIVRELTDQINFVELTAAELQTALDEAEKRGVRGGRVHDWLHVQAAKKAGVEKLFTENFADFSGLEEGFVVTAP
jgi:predicted nucleic acid-binding protein